MQRAELLAELERLTAEASVARERLAEILDRVRRLSEQLAEPGSPSGEAQSVARKVHSAG
jgi:hypothetical protein